MAISQRRELRQSQSLVMTPQLQQAIKLLQLSNVELVAYVEQELEQNPFLERQDANGDGPEDGGISSTSADAAPDTAAAQSDATTAEPGAVDASGAETRNDAGGDEGLSAGDRELSESASGESMPSGNEEPLVADYDNYWGNEGAVEAGAAPLTSSYTSTGGRSDFADDDRSLDQTLGSETSLRDHVMEQIQLDIAGAADRIIAVTLLDNLDESGYLTTDLDELSDGLGCALSDGERVLEHLQGFDPTGIFARSLKECLAIQLAELDRLDPAMATLLDNLELLAKREGEALKKLCGGDSEDLTEMVAEIRALNPRPASNFDTEVAQPVTPDILMRPRQGGGWMVELNPDTLPRVLVNHPYYALTSKDPRSQDAKEYLTEQFQSANWLVKSLHQRATTILKVATEIVRQQDMFFRLGVQHLKPLILRDIADVISMHESTVSRVTTNKFIATPRGVFELKYFFTSAIASADGGTAHSAEAVRHKIKTLIDAEKPNAILSDDRIVEILKDDGVDIARRTVAKYRESMKIQSSVQRRREKSLSL